MLLIALTLAIGVIALCNAAANVLSTVAPEIAVELAPHNGFALAAAANAMLAGAKPDSERASTLARKALERDPTNVPAIRTLAFALEMGGARARAARLLGYGQSLSLRDIPTQLWYIEDAVTRGDVPAALHHYDIALRSDAAVQPSLFPILVAATSDQAIVDGLVSVLARRPVWSEPFLIALTRDAPDFGKVALLVDGMRRAGTPAPPSVTVAVINRLGSERRFDAAWMLYAGLDRQAALAPLRNPDFSGPSHNSTIFDWNLASGSGLKSDPIVGGGGGLHFVAATNAAGPVAVQLLRIPIGRYMLQSATRSLSRGAGPSPSLRIRCADSDVVLATVALPDGAGAPVAFRQGFVVPAACDTQRLEIEADGGDEINGVSGDIGPIIIRSMGANP